MLELLLMSLLRSAQERYTALLRIIVDFQWQVYIAFCKSSCHAVDGLARTFEAGLRLLQHRLGECADIRL